MNEVKLPSYLTTVLAVFGSLVSGYLLKTGLVTADQLPILGSAALTIAIVIWRLYAKWHARAALVAAIAAPAGRAK